MGRKSNIIVVMLLIWANFTYSNEAHWSYVVEKNTFNGEIQTIPTDLPKNTIALEIYNSPINSLEHLSCYPELKTLIINNSPIYHFNEISFKLAQLKKLEYLSLCGSVNTFDLNILNKLKNLKHLVLSNNSGISIYGNPKWSKLKYLDIGGNKLKQLPRGLKYLRFLEEVISDGNDVQIFPNFFINNKKFKSVNSSIQKNTTKIIFTKNVNLENGSGVKNGKKVFEIAVPIILLGLIVAISGS